MRNLVIQLSICTVIWFGLIGLLAGCEYKAHQPAQTTTVMPTKNYDSISVELNKKYAIQAHMLDSLTSALVFKYDSIKLVNDSLRTKLFLAEYKIEKVRFYTKIVDKKPSQIVFYKGWIIRAIK